MTSVPSGPVHGTAAGVPYIALPPTAVDAELPDPVGLIVALHGLEPPRSAAAFAAAVPMTGVPLWRVYLSLPMSGPRIPAGGPDEIQARTERDYLTELYAPVVQQCAAELPDAVAEVREDLGLTETPVGLVGFSAGGAAVLLALAQDALEARACALIAPTVSPVRLVAGLEKVSGTSYPWTDDSRAAAERLDLTSHAVEIVAGDPAFMLVGGISDQLVPPADIAGLRDLLRAKGASRVEAATFKMAHALAEEPGTEPLPPTAGAVSVDAALTSWFRDRFKIVPRADNTDQNAADTDPTADTKPTANTGPTADTSPTANTEPTTANPEPATASTGPTAQSTGVTDTDVDLTAKEGQVIPPRLKPQRPQREPLFDLSSASPARS